MRLVKSYFLYVAGLMTLAGGLSGCTSLQEYVRNGFKVGPNYGRPPAPVAQNWIDAADERVRTESDELSQWWKVFNDPVLDSLVCSAYLQNLTLREAGLRVLEARAQLGIAVGNILPQTQTATGSFTWNAVSRESANRSFIAKRFFGQWDYAFNLAWELDFWGRFRRAIEGSVDSLDASVENYDSMLVTLLGDVATNYDQLRTTEQRIKYAKENVELQRQTLTLVEARFKAGTVSELDLDQARSTLAQTEATIPELEITLRQFNNQLCILLGVPPEELRAKLGSAPILTAPPEVAVGIPADLLRRRPDVRFAERQAAAQCAQIGVAEANFYPHISITGTFGYSAEFFKNLFKPTALTGSVGPSFQWNILNYGRILNNVRLQEATFQELVAAYQNAVLTAAQDVENGLVTFLKAQERTKFQAESVAEAEKAVKIALVQYKGGIIDLTRVTQLETTLVQLQDTLALAQGEIGLGLIQVYRALGGGWQIRLTGCEPTGLPPQGELWPADDALPAPQAEPAPVPPKPTPKGPTATSWMRTSRAMPWRLVNSEMRSLQALNLRERQFLRPASRFRKSQHQVSLFPSALNGARAPLRPGPRPAANLRAGHESVRRFLEGANAIGLVNCGPFPFNAGTAPAGCVDAFACYLKRAESEPSRPTGPVTTGDQTVRPAEPTSDPRLRRILVSFVSPVWSRKQAAKFEYALHVDAFRFVLQEPFDIV